MRNGEFAYEWGVGGDFYDYEFRIGYACVVRICNVGSPNACIAIWAGADSSCPLKDHWWTSSGRLIDYIRGGR